MAYSPIFAQIKQLFLRTKARVVFKQRMLLGAMIQTLHPWAAHEF